MSGLSKMFGRSLSIGLLASLSATSAFAGATLTGTVTYDGKIPNLKPLAMDADPACAAKHTSPVANEALVLGSGIVLTVGGSAWWHVSSVGHFVNSLHLWSVELFFMFMVIHLWGKFWMAAWRGRRTMTWVTGVAAFVASIGTAFTGYLSQSNFDSQWIGAEGKDGINAIGAGAFFNVLNPGQMLLWHVVLLPLVVGALTVIHIVLVRRHGVVPPIDATEGD